jgi:gluconolactonase
VSIAVAPSFVTHERAFEDVLGDDPQLELVAETDAHEGPVYVAAEDALYFTTLPRGQRVSVKRIQLDGYRFPVASGDVTVVREDANTANGMALDLAGRLVVCEQGTPSTSAGIGRIELGLGGLHETVVDSLRGLRLNSPNDVVVKSDGTIWFTDPTYGFLQGFRPEPELGDHVYRFDPETRRLTAVADSFDKPNGLAFSPDESVLYIGDSGANQEPGSFHPERPHDITALHVVAGGVLDERAFARTEPGFPDGIEVDSDGRVYASSFSGVQVFDPSGALLGEIDLPGAVNFTFGGPGGNVLFITADDAVWAAVLEAKGA